MPFRLVNLGPSISPILPVRKGILASRPTHPTINIGGSRFSESSRYAPEVVSISSVGRRSSSSGRARSLRSACVEEGLGVAGDLSDRCLGGVDCDGRDEFG